MIYILNNCNYFQTGRILPEGRRAPEAMQVAVDGLVDNSVLRGGVPVVVGVVDAPGELLVGGDHDDDVPVRLEPPEEGPRQLRLRARARNVWIWNVLTLRLASWEPACSARATPAIAVATLGMPCAWQPAEHQHSTSKHPCGQAMFIWAGRLWTKRTKHVPSAALGIAAHREIQS